VRLAIAHYSSPLDISGVSTWLERFALRLHNDGVQLYVHLHHFGDNPEAASILPDLIKAGIPVEVVMRGSTLEDDVRETLGFLNRVQPTLFLPQCLDAHFFAAAIAGRQGLPWVLTIHSDDPDYWKIANVRPPVEYGGKVVAVSEHIARLVKKQGGDSKPAVIPCGVDVPIELARFRNRPFRVVYSGRMVETQKRLSLVTATLIHACQKNPYIYATMIGDGPAIKFSQAAVERAELTQRIVFSGRLSPEQVMRELLDAQAILLMSDFEGLPVALLEAMAVGVVPVARAIPSGIPELVHHEKTGLLVDNNPEAAARTISRLADDPVLWQSCSVAARQLVTERYNENVCYQRWRELIAELCSSSKICYPLDIPDYLDLPVYDPSRNAGSLSLDSWFTRTVSRLKKGVVATSRYQRWRS